MPLARIPDMAVVTAYTVALGAVGAALAHALAFPAWVLMGPALLVSLAGLGGLRLGVADALRDVCLVVLGLAVGAGFDLQAGTAILRWPLAFVVLASMLVVVMGLGRLVLMRVFGFDRRSAALAAAPGHLSFVMGLASDIDADIGRIAVVQSIRLLFLTVSVPFAAQALGYRFGDMAAATEPAMAPPALAGLALAAVGAGLVLRRLRCPAPLLLGAMAVSALGHVTDLTPGAVPAMLLVPAFLVLGTLIGTRFAGMSRAQFAGSLLAGLSITAISITCACLAALPVALALSMPAAHVLAAFAPGGLETMIALGAAMGASPGFVAACHVARLLILVMLIPLFVGRRGTTAQTDA